MPLIIPSNSITGGYEVDNSLRFDDGSSDYLSRTPASDGNRKTWTLSFWCKRANLENGVLFSSGTNSNNFFRIYFAVDQLDLRSTISGVVRGRVKTTAVYRDPSAWYHFVVSLDSTFGTAAERMNVYVNGVLQDLTITNNFANDNHYWNSTQQQNIGVDYTLDSSSIDFFDGYLAEIYFIDGQQLDPTSFGEFDADTGIWKPIDVSGLTFGTNGFYLDFENSGSLGADVSSNGNNFTVNNLTSDDQMIDTPTNNFCTLNPLFRGGTVGETIEEGNLFYDSGDNRETFVCATQSVSTGKWYFEILPSATDTHGAYGFTNADNLLQTTSALTSPYDLNIGGMIRPDGNGTPSYKINSTSTTISVTTTSVFGIALDADTGDIEFFENNVSVGSGTITGITNYIPFANCHSSSTGRRAIATFNFGQDSSFAGSKTRQNNTDNNGQGDFYYAPPSGYYALNTKNLAEYG